MNTATPKELHAALRQFKHNNGTDEFVIGYDFDEINKAFATLKSKLHSQPRDVAAKEFK